MIAATDRPPYVTVSAVGAGKFGVGAAILEQRK